MKFNSDYVRRYLGVAPLALALERILECQLYDGKKFDRPILDIGCGEGLFAHVLLAEKVDTGIDPNPRELERAKELGAYRELIQCGGASVPKPDDSYRTIFSNSVFEHIPDLVPVLKEANRLLAPGGNFYFTVPSDGFEQYSVVAQFLRVIGLGRLIGRYGRFYNRFWQHYHCYPLQKWKELANASGFQVVEAFCYDSRSVCFINDALVPFSLPRLVMKRLFNRWVLFPRLRKILMFPASLVVRKFLKNGDRDERGGLVFIAATKR